MDPRDSNSSDMTAQSGSQLSPVKQAPLELWLAKQPPAVQTELIPRVANASEIPLSFAQKRLWLMQQIEPELTAYNETFVLRLRGPLDVVALRDSFSEIVRRHEILRTSIVPCDGEPVQIVRPPFQVDLVIHDLRALPRDERDVEWQRLAITEQRRPFDFTGQTFLRVTLLKLGDDEHLLLMSMHHIVCDRWSIHRLFQELSAIYMARRCLARQKLSDQEARGRVFGFSELAGEEREFLAEIPTGQFRKTEHPTPDDTSIITERGIAGSQSVLPELPLQYGEYSRRQRDRLEGPAGAKVLDYWRKQLADLPPLELPTDVPRPATIGYRGVRVYFPVPGHLVAAVETLARRERATPYMVLLAAFQTLMHRYSGQTDLAVGSPTAGRLSTDVEPLIGFFINTLVLRANLADNPTFRDFLRQVRQTALSAFQFQEAPFEKLTEILNLPRDPGRQPLVQVVFALQNSPPLVCQLEGLSTELVDVDFGKAKFDLNFSLRVKPDGWQGFLEYRTDLFDEATARRLVGHYFTLLEGIVADPDGRVGELPLLTEPERRQLLIDWNDTAADYPTDKCLHELFEEQVERTPNAVAIDCAGRRLTYHELNSSANQLAHRLRDCGVGPDVLVAICVGRSPELIVGILGILKAGGAYLPLDAEHPRERLAFLLQDAAAPVLLTQSSLLPLMPNHGAQVICVDADLPSIAAQSRANPVRKSVPHNLAYVLFTSGSTGKPKGVAIEHRSAVAFVAWAHQVFSPSDLAGVLAATSVGFDLSVFEMFAPLACGGKMILAPNVLALSTLAAAQDVTLLNTVPSAIAELIAQGEIPASVRTVNLAGEPLSQHLVREIYSHTKAQRVLDLYGPTESTIYATYALRTPDGPQTIGRPIANTRVYILDRHRQLVPVGVAGEIHIGGDGLARGYLNRPELTTERFIPDPFGAAGSRLYKTGDLARYLPDGNVEFLGRLDHQVKLRGFRIELGEIETALLQLPGVHEAVVVAREDDPGDKRLVAYVVPQSGAAICITALCDVAKRLLPQYMVPSAFLVLEKLPLTPNGKLDRKALPVPAARDMATEAVAPRTPIEELLVGIWESVLGVEQVGIHDNFFELGGHSLLAMRVISRLRDQFAIDLPVRSLFESPTVAELGARIERMRSQEPTEAIPPLQRVSREGALPLSFAQERLWFFDQFEPASAVYNIRRILHLRGPLNVPALERSFQEFVRRHEVLRTSFANVNGQPQPVLHDAAAFGMTVTDLRSVPAAAREAEARRQAAEEIGRPFDLSRDLMLRAQLWLLGEQDHVLALTMHHIASDGWSAGVFSRELGTLYAAYSSDQPSPLPELPIQYADYAVWQRKWLQGAVLERQLAYWKQQLAGAPAALELPTDFPRPTVQSYRGGSQELVLSAEFTQALQMLSRREGVTPFMTLLAAFQVLLSRYSGQEDVSVGAPIAGRNRVEVEGLAGMFVNTLVLRTDLSGNPTFQELLRRVREVTLGAYAHQDLPFEKLVEELRPERNLSHSPLFQAMFVLQNAPASPLALPEVTIEAIAIDSSTTKFDLTLSLHETADGLRGSLAYNTDLFDEATARRLIGHYFTLLEGIVADPDGRVGELPLLTEPERRQLLIDWNDTATDYPRDQCIHELFEDQASQRPDSIALVCGEQALTYRELNDRADRLACQLREQGVRPDTLVGLCVERSIEMIVGMLGILKAGGAYVPLDPNYPPERLAFLREDSQTQLVLRRDDLLPSASSRAAIRLCRADEDSSEETSFDGNQTLSPDGLAYVMYTSGSTGEPKGVCVTHRGVVRLVKNTNYVRLSSSDRFLQCASPSFDAATFEIWGCLLNGGRLVLPPPGALSLDELGCLVRKQGITVLWLTAGVFHLMVEHHVEDLRTVQQLLAGGDVLSPAHVRRALDVLPGTTLINGYGPTENTTFSTCHVMTSSSSVGATVPIGRPIPNSQVYILDPLMQPVPIGVAGELCVGGAGVARGYHRRPELTAEKFVPNPFGPPGSRLYRTGDLARYRAEGTIEFLGRRDCQVKIRGHRVEPGEIEAALMQHPAVSQCAVVARADDDGDKRLIGYVVLADIAVATDDLRRHLSERLPSFLVPSRLVVLDVLPLTPHGKVDRAALSVPEARDVVADVVAPCDALEIQLTRIWEDVLNVRPIGVSDNFFELGGHSLLAVKLFDRMAKATGQNLPLATLFECPTIKHLAEVLRKRNWSPPWKSLVPVQPGGSKPPLFLVPPAAGSVLRFAELARHLGQDQPVYGLEPLGHDDRHPPQDRVEDMASLYLKELRELQPIGPYLLAGICFGGFVAWEMARQLEQQGSQVALVALLDPNAPRHGPTWSPTRRSIKEIGQRVMCHLAPGWLSRSVFKLVARQLKWIQSSGHAASRRRLRMLDAHRKAQMSYLARPHAGHVLFIQSEEFSQSQRLRERWGELATVRFEHVVVPGTTHRDLLLGSRHTPALAQLLREHLDRAIVESASAEHTTVSLGGAADNAAPVRSGRAA